MESTEATIIDRQREILVHMLGAGSHVRPFKHGYRNRFCAEIGSDDYRTLVELEAAGLVKAGYKINNDRDQYFSATLDGCKAIGLGAAAIKRAFGDKPGAW